MKPVARTSPGSDGNWLGVPTPPPDGHPEPLSFRKLRVLDLFSGIGGFSLGLECTDGFETVAFCEIDPFCRKILTKHWPNVRQYEDVRTLTADALRGDGIAVDIICGGFPCQDISKGGPGTGIAGERSGLWSEFRRLIDDLRPQFAIIENVPELRSRGLDTVLWEIAALGYDAEWHCIPAAAVGAPTRRDRIWIIAYPIGSRMEGLLQGGVISQAGPWGWRGEADLLAIAGSPFKSGPRWPQPLIRRVDARVPDRMVRIEKCGNAVVPQIPELIGRYILEARAA